jgi:hypothetical protein
MLLNAVLGKSVAVRFRGSELQLRHKREPVRLSLAVPVLRAGGALQPLRKDFFYQEYSGKQLASQFIYEICF